MLALLYLISNVYYRLVYLDVAFYLHSGQLVFLLYLYCLYYLYCYCVYVVLLLLVFPYLCFDFFYSYYPFIVYCLYCYWLCVPAFVVVLLDSLAPDA